MTCKHACHSFLSQAYRHQRKRTGSGHGRKEQLNKPTCPPTKHPTEQTAYGTIVSFWEGVKCTSTFVGWIVDLACQQKVLETPSKVMVSVLRPFEQHEPVFPQEGTREWPMGGMLFKTTKRNANEAEAAGGILTHHVHVSSMLFIFLNSVSWSYGWIMDLKSKGVRPWWTQNHPVICTWAIPMIDVPQLSRSR